MDKPFINQTQSCTTSQSRFPTFGLKLLVVWSNHALSVSTPSGAIASTEVKLKLQEFLLSKKEPPSGGLNHSFPQKCW